MPAYHRAGAHSAVSAINRKNRCTQRGPAVFGGVAPACRRGAQMRSQARAAARPASSTWKSQQSTLSPALHRSESAGQGPGLRQSAQSAAAEASAAAASRSGPGSRVRPQNRIVSGKPGVLFAPAVARPGGGLPRSHSSCRDARWLGARLVCLERSGTFKTVRT